jgi:hypothetical protein
MFEQVMSFDYLDCIIVKDSENDANSWSIILLEKLIFILLVIKYSAFYGTLRFITMFTRAHKSEAS